VTLHAFSQNNAAFDVFDLAYIIKAFAGTDVADGA